MLPDGKPASATRAGTWARLRRGIPRKTLSLQDEGYLRSRLVKAGFWTTSSFLVLSIANYVFTLALSRLLHIADYGSFGVVSSILLLEGMIASSAFPWTLSMTIAAHSGPDADISTRTTALSTALIGNGVLGVVSGAGVALVTANLVPGHPLLPLITGLTALVTTLSAVWESFYGGERRFALWWVLRIAEVSIKVVLGIVLVAAGFGLEAAIGAAMVGSAVSVVWGASRVRRVSFPRRGEWWDSSAVRTVWWTAIAQFGLAVMLVIDLLSIRALATGSQATIGSGYYQAANVLGRVPVFISMALQTAIFPFLVACKGDREAETRLVRVAIRVTLLIPVPMALVLIGAPTPMIRFLFPASFLPAAELLRLTALAGLPLIALSLAVVLLQATRGMRSAALAVLPGLAIEVVLLVVAVPRYGTIGAPYAVAAGALGSATLAFYWVSRRWPLRTVTPPVSVVACLAFIGLASAVVPMPGRSLPLVLGVLGITFTMVLWLLGVITAHEMLPITPQALHPLLHWLSAHEGTQHRH